jgi:hypothetical protein
MFGIECVPLLAGPAVKSTTEQATVVTPENLRGLLPDE